MKKRKQEPLMDGAIELQKFAECEELVKDKSVCFLCQETPPEFKIIRDTDNEYIVLCTECKDTILEIIELENEIKRTMAYKDNRHILQYTLGMDLRPRTIKIEAL